jgi:uncharacterized protein YgbK (DUF1537 family)
MDLLVVADDLTGANDTGAAFAERGLRTAIRDVDAAASGDWPAAVDVGVVDTDARYADSTVAAERVERAVATAPDVPVYLKVDSTLRGNLVASVDAAMDTAGVALVVVAPAFPAADRRTAGGYHLVDGVPVAETEMGNDPDAPVTSSHVPTLFSGVGASVTHATLDDVDGSLGATLSSHADADDPTVVVCDATAATHLDAIADAAAAVEGPVLLVGSAGLARHVRLGESGPALGVVGSVAPETLAQLDAVPDEGIVALDPRAVVTDTQTSVDRAVERAVGRLGSNETTVVTAATDGADVETTLAAGREAGLSESQTRTRVESALASVAARVHSRAEPSGLFATGGAVARATLDELDADGVTLSGRSVETGIPLGVVDGGDAVGTPVVTKAGGFGSETAIVNALRVLETHHEASRGYHDG